MNPRSERFDGRNLALRLVAIGYTNIYALRHTAHSDPNLPPPHFGKRYGVQALPTRLDEYQ
jgi:hypothetical protein